MKINIQSIHFSPSQSLNGYVTEKVKKLSHLYDRIESAEVSLKLDKSSTIENNVCEIKVGVPGNDLFASRQCKTFEQAATETVEALSHQIEKMKTKMENR
jgi:putative sigma-54 modulation protein